MAGRSNEEIPSGDTFLAAWLYRPDGGDGGEKRPLVIMGHGIGGVREMRLDAYAERFAAADWASWSSTTATSAPAGGSRASW
jgi:dienelactone hydrolase